MAQNNNLGPKQLKSNRPWSVLAVLTIRFGLVQLKRKIKKLVRLPI